MANSGELSPRHRKTEPPAVTRRRAPRPLCPGPLDPESTPTIRIRSDRIWTTGSRSSGRKPRVTVRPGDFVKETSTFLVINPRSSLFQK